VVIKARAAAAEAECPGCGTRSGRVHGRYQRSLGDTPLAGQPVVIRLLVRRFVCAEPGCGRSTFAEQVTGLTAPHVRYAPPLRAALTSIAIALASRAGARLANRIRAAIDRLLRGDIPAGGGCDVSTLARGAGVDRTAFYGARPYAHLREEFETRLRAQREAGQIPDRHHAQITRLKHEIDMLQRRLAARDQTIATLTDFKTEALSRLAAQHEEITRLRAAVAASSNIRHLPTRAATIGPCWLVWIWPMMRSAKRVP
jgi:hypothetical protein